MQETNQQRGSQSARTGPFVTTRRNRITGHARGLHQGPPGVVAATFTTRDEAVTYVQDLRHDGLDVSGMQIVGRELMLIEHVLGARTWRSMLVPSAMSGLVVGGLLGMTMGAFDPVAPLSSAIFGLLLVGLVGLVVGMLIGVVGYLLAPSSLALASGLAARRYEVLVPAAVRERAARSGDDASSEAINAHDT